MASDATTHPNGRLTTKSTRRKTAMLTATPLNTVTIAPGRPRRASIK